MASPTHALRSHPGECTIGEAITTDNMPTWDLTQRIWTWHVRVGEDDDGYPVVTRVFTAGWLFADDGSKTPIWFRVS